MESGAVSASIRERLEEIARELSMQRGRWRLELNFEQGRLRDYYRHEERVPAGRLERPPRA